MKITESDRERLQDVLTALDRYYETIHGFPIDGTYEDKQKWLNKKTDAGWVVVHAAQRSGEALQRLLQCPSIVLPKVGEEVIVVEGPFLSLCGVVEAVDAEKGRVQVGVESFGRRVSGLFFEGEQLKKKE